ncbi:trypco2 family protein [Pedobacter sp. SL55]|uniref:trypco2 family protein n=1 Tax=Pedobacter sp. SL55 TaxID=2995161 RepID=UPI00226E3333|nr:trypco2 family protein [Pedobacter sp. SL55]WAC42234.1 hypothetical protein OVA16_07730 [Pedobacter sp. SL55]
MKRILFFLVISGMLVGGSHAQQQKDDIETFELKEIVSLINNSLEKASKELDVSMQPKLQSAEITLSTIYNKTGGGGFKIIAKASKKWQLERSTTLTFSYEKNNNKGLLTLSFEVHLKDAVVAASQQWAGASTGVTGLSKKEFSVELSFSLKKSGSGGVEFEVWGIGIDASVDVDKTVAHKVKLTFK